MSVRKKRPPKQKAGANGGGGATGRRGANQGKVAKKKLKFLVSSAVGNNLKVTNEAIQALLVSQQAITAAISSNAGPPAAKADMGATDGLSS